MIQVVANEFIIASIDSFGMLFDMLKFSRSQFARLKIRELIQHIFALFFRAALINIGLFLQEGLYYSAAS